MDQIPLQSSEKPPLRTLPPPDFSIPPPTIPESAKSVSATTTRDEKLPKESSRYNRGDSRDKERSRYSPRPSSSRDYRSQSRYSSSSRYSSRRSPDRQREGYKRKRSKSRSPSRQSSRRSPSHRSTTSHRSPLPRTSHRDTRDAREPARSNRRPSKDPPTERERLLVKWRQNFCETSDQISKKLQEMANDEEQASWIRASPADIYYRRAKENMESTVRLDALCTLFDEELLKRTERAKAAQVPYVPPIQRRKIRACRHTSKLND